MTRVARLRRDAGRSFLVSMTTALLVFPSCGGSWLLFGLHPVLSILLALVAAALALVAIVEGREAVRLFDAAAREDFDKLRLPRF